MKAISKYFLGSIFLVVFAAALSSCFGYSMSEKRKIAYRITDQLEKDFKDKYGLRFAGISEAAPEGKYKEIGFVFYSTRTLNREESRVILVDCSEKILHAFNSNSEFKEYMDVYPFTYSNISMTIHVLSEENYELYYPDLAVASIYDGILEYKTYTPESEEKHRYYTEETETLKEAMEIVEAQRGGS